MAILDFTQKAHQYLSSPDVLENTQWSSLVELGSGVFLLWKLGSGFSPHTVRIGQSNFPMWELGNGTSLSENWAAELISVKIEQWS